MTCYELTGASGTLGTARESLPAGWRWVRLGDVCVEDRRIVEPGSQPAVTLPYLSLEHIESNRGRILRNPAEGFEGAGASTTFAFDGRHILYGKLRPYLNKVALPDFEGRCTTELVPLLPRAGAKREFVAWLLRRPETVGAAMREKTGSRMPRANMGELLRLEVPLPPLGEQMRITAILERQMALIERARAAAEDRLEAAKALPAAYLRTIFESPTAHQWTKTPLGCVGEVVSGVTLGRKLNSRSTRTVPYMRVANVKDGYLDLSGVYEIEATEDEIEKCRLRQGDLLLTEGGDPDKLGRGTVWDEQIPECIHQNHIFRVRFPQDQLLPEFVSAQIGSSYGKAYFLRHAKQTTGIATINQKVLKAFPLIVPPMEEQRRIVGDLNAQLTRAGNLREALLNEMDALNVFPAALLRRAFAGEL